MRPLNNAYSVSSIRGDTNGLSRDFNEDFVRGGIREGQVPYGRPAVAQTSNGFRFIVPGNVILWGDLGERMYQKDETSPSMFI